jgi:hypothetical protein
MQDPRPLVQQGATRLSQDWVRNHNILDKSNFKKFNLHLIITIFRSGRIGQTSQGPSGGATDPAGENH